MTPQERIEAFWAGEKPDRIPYTIYWWEWRNFADDPAWQPMYKDGLRVTYDVSCIGSRTKNMDYSEQSYEQDGKQVLRKTMKTPVGEIQSIAEDGWTQQYWIKTAEDYKVMKYIAENTEIYPDYEQFLKTQKESPEHFLIRMDFGARTPMQTILVDFLGLENFALHLLDFENELMELYEALLKVFKKRVEIAAEGPGRYVEVLENFTAETMGPARFARFHVPVYKELYPILQSAGKIVGNHFDGRLAICKDLIAESPIDLIESLTPPPEGDMTLAEARAAWPEKLFWSNINVSTYQLEPKKLKETIFEAIKQAAPDGRRLAFEVSEAISENWRQSMPVVLEALKEASG